MRMSQKNVTHVCVQIVYHAYEVRKPKRENYTSHMCASECECVRTHNFSRIQFYSIVFSFAMSSSAVWSLFTFLWCAWESMSIKSQRGESVNHDPAKETNVNNSKQKRGRTAEKVAVHEISKVLLWARWRRYREARIDVVRKGNKNRSVDYKFCWRWSFAEYQQQKKHQRRHFYGMCYISLCVDLILIVVVAVATAASDDAVVVAAAAIAITICHCHHSLDSALHSNLFFAHFLFP